MTVHALATLAGEGHRVRLLTRERDRVPPAVPIMLGFAMPAHAEMASPIKPAPASQITLVNELPRHVIIISSEVNDCSIRSVGETISDESAHQLPKGPSSRPASQPSTQP